MKRFLFLLLAFVSTLAFATNKPPVTPDPKPNTSTSTSTAGAAADAAAKANAGVGDINITNGGGADGASGSYSDDDRFYVLPAPVFTPPLPAINSPCTNTSQEAFSAGWSAVSVARGGTSTDNCVAIEMYNAAIKTCRYATAGQIMDLLTVKVLAGFQPPPRAALLDLTPAECTALQAPPKPQPTSYQLIPAEPVKPKLKPKAAIAKKPADACKGTKTGYVMTGCL